MSANSSPTTPSLAAADSDMTIIYVAAGACAALVLLMIVCAVEYCVCKGRRAKKNKRVNKEDSTKSIQSSRSTKGQKETDGGGSAGATASTAAAPSAAALGPSDAQQLAEQQAVLSAFLGTAAGHRTSLTGRPAAAGAAAAVASAGAPLGGSSSVGSVGGALGGINPQTVAMMGALVRSQQLLAQLHQQQLLLQVQHSRAGSLQSAVAAAPGVGVPGGLSGVALGVPGGLSGVALGAAGISAANMAAPRHSAPTQLVAAAGGGAGGGGSFMANSNPSLGAAAGAAAAAYHQQLATVGAVAAPAAASVVAPVAATPAAGAGGQATAAESGKEVPGFAPKDRLKLGIAAKSKGRVTSSGLRISSIASIEETDESGADTV